MASLSFSVRVPEPLASSVRFSLEPDEIARSLTPAAAAAATTSTPVAAEEALASTESAGLVAPFGP
jgi:hypothetical protein